MHIRKVDLINFCQHRKLSVEFHPGVTGVLGGNGRGKSNLLKGVRFALIKESGNTGVMAADLNWGAALAGESGFVELAFEKGGTDGKVKRFVDKGKASLRFGATKAASSKAVDEAMGDILVVPKRVIEEIVFVDQGAIERVLFERPADRAKQFQALFGTGSAEAIRGLLQKELAAISDSPVDEQIVRLQKQLDTAIDPQLRSFTGTHEQLAKAIEGFDEASHHKIMEAFAVAQKLGESIVEMRRQVAALEADVDSGRRVAAGLESQVAELQTATDSERDAVSKARERVGALKLLKRTSAMRTQLLKSQEEQTGILATTPPTPPTMTQGKVEEGRTKLGRAVADIEPKRAFVQAFKDSEADATCPTCMQPVQNAAELATQFGGEVSDQDERIACVTAMLNKADQAIRAYQSAAKEDDVRRSLASQRLMEVEQQLNTLGATEYDPDEVAALTAKLQAFDIREKQLVEAAHNLQAKQVNVAAARTSLADRRMQLAELEAKVTEAPTSEQYDKSEQALQGFSDAKEQIAGIVGQLEQLQSQRASVITELDQLKEEADKLGNVRRYKDLCERARTVLHRDCLPLVVTRSFLAALNARMAEYLQTFNIPFLAEIKDDLTVVCTFPGVGEQDAGRLSGGQRVALGIAFRFAVYRLFAGELGFMVLDEPTAHLDNDKIQNVVDVLQSVRRHAHNTGMQLVVITHEPELAPAFDHIVRL